MRGSVQPLGGLSGFLALGATLLLASCAQPQRDPSTLRAGFLPEGRPQAKLPRISGLGMDDTEPLGRGAPEPIRETVRYPSADADLFDGTPTILEAALYRPAGKGPFPVVVALHDCMGLYGPSGAMNSHMRDWAERLVAQGYAVLMPDSFNPRGVPEMCSRDPDLIRPGVERSRDARGSLDWLQTQPWAAGNRVGLVGWANGGTTALTFATSDGRLHRRFGEPDFRVIVAFYPNCTTLALAPGWRSDLPLIVLTGSNDNWAPAEACVSLAGLIGNTGGALDLVKYYGASHEFDAPGMPLHVKTGITTTVSGGATIGTDPQARADAVERVTRLLATTLNP